MTDQMSTDSEILGRELNDLEAIMSVVNTDVDAVVHAVRDNADAIFTWDYEKGARPALKKLYEKAKTSQWNAETDLDWSIDVDPEKILTALTGGPDGAPTPRPGRSPTSATTPTRPSRAGVRRSGPTSPRSR